MSAVPHNHDVATIAQHVIGSARDFLQAFRGAHISPELFLRIPGELQKINWLAEILEGLGNDMQPGFALYLLEESRVLWDQLLEVENVRMDRLPPLQGVLEREEGPHGRTRLFMSQEFVTGLIYDAGLSNVEISQLTGCSLRTLERRLSQWGLRRRAWNVNDQELFVAIWHIKATVGPFYGVRAISGILRSQNILAPREKVRSVLRAVDPEGAELRWRQAVYRRKYSVPFVNSLWHIDGNHKLRRWDIVVHGGIDGKSRATVYLHASDNNRATTVETLFLKATQSWGWPSRVRADWGGENVMVKTHMENVRGRNRGSFFAGPSTHNQRIERLWKDVFAWCLRIFYALFRHMEELGILNPDDEIHLWALHLVFLPRINQALRMFVETWNHHKISTEKNRSPHELFFRGMIEAQQLGFFLNPGPQHVLDDNHDLVRIHHPDFTQYGARFAPQRERNDDDPNVVIEGPAQGLFSDAEIAWINQRISEISEEADYLSTEKYCMVFTLLEVLHQGRLNQE